MQALAVHEQPQAVALEHDVALALLVERQLVLESRAAAAAHAHAQPRDAHIRLLAGEEVVHLLGALVSYRDHDVQYTRGRDTLCAVPKPEDIKQRIEAAIPGAQAEVEDFTGGGDHFRATVTAPAFAGRTRIEQHRLVYEIFDGEIGGPIHALSLKTQTPPAAGAGG